MSRSRQARVRIILAALAAVLTAFPASASADLTITDAKLNGVTSISSPPGGVMEAQLKGSATGGDNWRSTRWRFGDDPQCNNHSNGTGDRNVNFNVTAPGQPGEYDAGFTASGTDDCKAPTSAEKVLQQALRVTQPAPNPNLPPRCGIEVMLVLDKSGSIANSGATEAVRNATRAFLDALSGTGAQVSITDFSTQAAWQVDYTTVTSETISGVFEPYLTDRYNPAGWTNWEDAFKVVREVNADPDTPRADLVVFITDGDPTARNTDSGGVVTGLVEGEVEALRRATAQADLVKGQGSHVFALGVGAAVTKPTSERRLTAVSGFDQYPGTEFAKADYTLVQDFADLGKALRRIATELCEASVTVTKVVDEGDGAYRPDPDWEFTASVATTPGGYTWLQPQPPPATGPRSRTTNRDGVATFQWKPDNADAQSTVTIEETLKAGFDFVDASCATTAPNRRRRRLVRQVVSTSPSFQVDVGPNQYAKCTVRNRIQPGTIEIEKAAYPQSGQEFLFSGSAPLGDFTLTDERGGSSASRVFTGLAPGTYTVRELVPENWELNDVVCSEPSAVVSGPEVTITIGPNEAVVCTYRDRRVDPPGPPVPPIPPTPPTPPTPPVPPIPPESAELRVTKTAPRVTRVGRRVRFRLTVTNTGPVAARNVQLLDVPPAAVALASLRSGARARVVRGNALWRLGRLDPGERRTVRGSVRIQAGSPGLKRNLVLATAVNADLVSDAADTRLLRPRVPPVTG